MTTQTTLAALAGTSPATPPTPDPATVAALKKAVGSFVDRVLAMTPVQTRKALRRLRSANRKRIQLARPGR